jgi:hypothetical protein
MKREEKKRKLFKEFFFVYRKSEKKKTDDGYTGWSCLSMKKKKTVKKTRPD